MNHADAADALIGLRRALARRPARLSFLDRRRLLARFWPLAHLRLFIQWRLLALVHRRRRRRRSTLARSHFHGCARLLGRPGARFRGLRLRGSGEQAGDYEREGCKT